MSSHYWSLFITCSTVSILTTFVIIKITSRNLTLSLKALPYVKMRCSLELITSAVYFLNLLLNNLWYFVCTFIESFLYSNEYSFFINLSGYWVSLNRGWDTTGLYRDNYEFKLISQSLSCFKSICVEQLSIVDNSLTVKTKARFGSCEHTFHDWYFVLYTFKSHLDKSILILLSLFKTLTCYFSLFYCKTKRLKCKNKSF